MLRSAEGVVVDAAGLSDPGRDPDKQTNEDALALAETPFGVVAMVCDGMGGHESGELASRAAAQRILETLSKNDQRLDRLLATAIERAHAEVYALGGDAPVDVRPGSTVVVLALAGPEALVAHVGDSRAYRVRARRTERLTRDHSVVEALLAAGAITEDAAKHRPDANRITRALGISADVEPELRAPMQVELGDAFVLCSDGLSDLVEDGELGELVAAAASPEVACRALVDLANDRGGHDNISVIVLRVLAVGTSRGDTRGHTVEMPPERGATVVDGPSFTVAMTKAESNLDGDTKRNTVPTLVDPVAVAQQLGLSPRPAQRTEPEIRLESPTRPPQVPSPPAHLMVWASVGVAVLILLAIALWSAVR